MHPGKASRTLDIFIKIYNLLKNMISLQLFLPQTLNIERTEVGGLV